MIKWFAKEVNTEPEIVFTCLQCSKIFTLYKNNKCSALFLKLVFYKRVLFVRKYLLNHTVWSKLTLFCSKSYGGVNLLWQIKRTQKLVMCKRGFFETRPGSGYSTEEPGTRHKLLFLIRSKYPGRVPGSVGNPVPSGARVWFTGRIPGYPDPTYYPGTRHQVSGTRTSLIITKALYFPPPKI